GGHGDIAVIGGVLAAGGEAGRVRIDVEREERGQGLGRALRPDDGRRQRRAVMGADQDVIADVVASVVRPLRRRRAAGRGGHQQHRKHRRRAHAQRPHASRAPSSMNSAPAPRSMRRRRTALRTKKARSRAAAPASTRHQIPPMDTKVAPRVRKATLLEAPCGSMNCSRKARKNSATFGFSRLVSAPWTKARLALDGGDGIVKSYTALRASNSRAPRYIRYAAPHSFTATKAGGNAFKSRDSPAAAANVCTTLPAVMPRAEATPDLRPPLRLRPRM